jgi:hypothetical protein
MIPDCACGSSEVIAISPGEEDERLVAGGFIIRRGRPDKAWCMACWPCAPRPADAPAEAPQP